MFWVIYKWHMIIAIWLFNIVTDCSHLDITSNIILKSFKSKKYCSKIYLDVQQVFDRAWHRGRLLKIKHAFPHHYCIYSNRIFPTDFFRQNFVMKLHNYTQLLLVFFRRSVLRPIYTFSLQLTCPAHLTWC